MKYSMNHTPRSERAIQSVSLGVHIGGLKLFVDAYTNAKVHRISLTAAADVLWTERHEDKRALERWIPCSVNDMATHMAQTATFNDIVRDIEERKVDADTAFIRATAEIARYGV